MHIYYIAGIPYSDDLYHSGVKGQKWGLRRYQYEDGTLTPLGKIHYGAQKTGQAVSRAVKATGKAVGRAGKAVVKYEVDKFKRNHPWMMSNSELDETLKRAKTIEAISASRQAARGRTFKGKLGDAGWTLVNKFAGTMGDNLGKKLGEGAAQKILQGSDKREAEKIRGEIELETAKKGQREEKLKIRKANDRLDKEEREYNKSIREERRKEREKKAASREKGKSHVNSSKNKAKNAKTSAAKAASSAKASKGEKWTKKSNVLEADYIFDSYGDYSSAKRGSMIRRG